MLIVDNSLEKRTKRFIVRTYRSIRDFSLQAWLQSYVALANKQLGRDYTLAPRHADKLKQAYAGGVLASHRHTVLRETFGVTDADLQAIEADFEALFHDLEVTMEKSLSFTRQMNMPREDMRSLYLLARVCEPTTVLETGVANGVSSVILLNILRSVLDSHLHSIDVDNGKIHGQLIPADLRDPDQWTLHLQAPQSTQPLLPDLLEELGTVDFFLHDSLHRFEHMMWEYETAWSYVRAGGVLASHDVLDTSAFAKFSAQYADEIAASHTIGNFGFIVKRNA